MEWAGISRVGLSLPVGEHAAGAAGSLVLPALGLRPGRSGSDVLIPALVGCGDGPLWPRAHGIADVRSAQRRAAVCAPPTGGHAHVGRPGLDLLVDPLVAGVLNAPAAVDLHVAVVVEGGAADVEPRVGENVEVVERPHAAGGAWPGEGDLRLVDPVAGDHRRVAHGAAQEAHDGVAA